MAGGQNRTCNHLIRVRRPTNWTIRQPLPENYTFLFRWCKGIQRKSLTWHSKIFVNNLNRLKYFTGVVPDGNGLWRVCGWLSNFQAASSWSYLSHSLSDVSSQSSRAVCTPMMAISFTLIGGLTYLSGGKEALKMFMTTWALWLNKAVSGFIVLCRCDSVDAGNFRQRKKIAESIIKYAAELGGATPSLFQWSCSLYPQWSSPHWEDWVKSSWLDHHPSYRLTTCCCRKHLPFRSLCRRTLNPTAWSLYTNTLGIESPIWLHMPLSFAIYMTTTIFFSGSNACLSKRILVSWSLYQYHCILFHFLNGRSRPAGRCRRAEQLDWIYSRHSGLMVYLAGTILGAEAAHVSGQCWPPSFLPYCQGPLHSCIYSRNSLRVYHHIQKGGLRLLSKSIIIGSESVMPSFSCLEVECCWLQSITMCFCLYSRATGNCRWFPMWSSLPYFHQWRSTVTIKHLGPWGWAWDFIKCRASTKGHYESIFFCWVMQEWEITNTHNVWIANYLGVDVIEFTKKTFIYVVLLPFWDYQRQASCTCDKEQEETSEVVRRNSASFRIRCRPSFQDWQAFVNWWTMKLPQIADAEPAQLQEPWRPEYPQSSGLQHQGWLTSNASQFSFRLSLEVTELQEIFLCNSE